jgi:hypothetical protein
MLSKHGILMSRVQQCTGIASRTGLMTDRGEHRRVWYVTVTVSDSTAI